MKKRKNMLASIPVQKQGNTMPVLSSVQNPVAKYAHRFNKACIFADKSKYRRNLKHRKQEASPITLGRVIGEAFCTVNQDVT